MKTINDLRIKIFADGADKAGMLEMHGKPYIKGFTTNPTLMRKAGVTDYRIALQKWGHFPYLLAEGRAHSEKRSWLVAENFLQACPLI